MFKGIPVEILYAKKNLRILPILLHLTKFGIIIRKEATLQAKNIWSYMYENTGWNGC